MIPLVAKLIASVSVSLLSVILFITFKGDTRRGCMVAMILCTFADFFMTDFFGLGDVSLYPGAGLFMLAHVIYALTFIRAEKRKGYKYVNAGFFMGIAYVSAIVILMTVLAFKVPEPVTSMYFLILIYIAVITFNLLSQYSYAINELGTTHLLIPAMTLFLFSDFIIFLNMLNVTPAHNDLVWLTYIPAQLLIVLFNGSFKKEEEQEQ